MSSMSEQRSRAKRLQAELEHNPRRYQARLLAWVLLGYAVPVLLLILTLGLALGLLLAALTLGGSWLLVALKLLWIPLIYGLILLRALWLRFTPPEGQVLSESQAPQLFAEVERLRLAAGAPKLTAILVNGEFNAAAVSMPRAWGLLPSRHYLLLGLPLMQSLGCEQLRSVIAHEFGHFGGRHGRFGGWIYRLRNSWQLLLAGLENGDLAQKLLARFFSWYSPRFDALSLALLRHHEYQADRMAAALVGAKPAAEALLRITVLDEWLERNFWPRLSRLIADRAEPPAQLYRQLAEQLTQMPPPAPAQTARVLARSDDPDDTHPGIASRLAALGQSPDQLDLSAPAKSAAEIWLGEALPMLSDRLSHDWQQVSSAGWAEQHQEFQAQAEQLRKLEAQPDWSPAERADLLRLRLQLNPEADVEAACRAGLIELPNDAWLHFRLGQHLLEHDRGEGVEHLHTAMAQDPDCAPHALELLYQFHRQHGHDAALDEVHALMQEKQARFNARLQQRTHLHRHDHIRPHQLPEETLQSLRHELEASGWVRRAWLVEKVLEDDNGPPHFLLLVAQKRITLLRAAQLDKLNDAIGLPGSWHLFTAEQMPAIARKVRRAPGAQIYPQR